MIFLSPVTPGDTILMDTGTAYVVTRIHESAEGPDAECLCVSGDDYLLGSKKTWAVEWLELWEERGRLEVMRK